MTERLFPVHGDLGRQWKKHPTCPRTVPWRLLVPHEVQVIGNHSQTLQRLAERGGLSPGEIRCAVEGKGLFKGRVWNDETERDDVEWLIRWLAGDGKADP